MNLTQEELSRKAAATGFGSESLEKVFRLMALARHGKDLGLQMRVERERHHQDAEQRDGPEGDDQAGAAGRRGQRTEVRDQRSEIRGPGIDSRPARKA